MRDRKRHGDRIGRREMEKKKGKKEETQIWMVREEQKTVEKRRERMEGKKYDDKIISCGLEKKKKGD